MHQEHDLASLTFFSIPVDTLFARMGSPHSILGFSDRDLLASFCRKTGHVGDLDIDDHGHCRIVPLSSGLHLFPGWRVSVFPGSDELTTSGFSGRFSFDSLPEARYT